MTTALSSSSSLEYALLGLLRQKPQSGYDLRKIFAITPMRHFSDSPGSIYPALRRMKARRWVSASAENGGARKRQEFAVTQAGTRALVHWLRQPVTREDVIWRLEQLMLRFAFLDGNVERSVDLTFLDELERELAAYIRELREHDKMFALDMRSSTGYLAFKGGIESYQARLLWARQVRKQLKEELS
jgi:DNA-binding PadR family transcriptional regulator